jgi:mono/diheme cytochrome c family protein
MAAAAGGRGRGGITPEQQATLERGAAIYNELCSICHGPDGRGTAGDGPATMKAPSFVGSARLQGHRDYVIKTILHGLTGPLDGRTYTDVMIPMGSNRDDWVAAVASYLRNSFGNSASFVTSAEVARVRAATGHRKTPWTQPELEASLPVPLVAQAPWKASASHNTQTASGGLNFQGWSTGAPQQAGMWYQIELPDPVMLSEIQFNSTMQAPGRGGVPGGRGVGGRGAAQPPAPVATYPRGYRVQVSLDGNMWSAPVAEGQGSGPTTVIAFRPVRVKFIRITQIASPENAPAWTIQRLRLYQAPARATAAATR